MSARHNCESEMQREIEEFEANVDAPDRPIQVYQEIIARHDDCPGRGCSPEMYGNILHRINHRFCIPAKEDRK